MKTLIIINICELHKFQFFSTGDNFDRHFDGSKFGFLEFVRAPQKSITITSYRVSSELLAKI